MSGKPEEKIIDRVKKLIALTENSNENEARNSAFQACKLIREHSLVVMGKVAHKPASPPGSGYRPPQEARRGGYGRPSYSERDNRYDSSSRGYDPHAGGGYSSHYRADAEYANVSHGGGGREAFKTDTKILTDKQFLTAVRLAEQYKEGLPQAGQFFSAQEVQKVLGSKVALAYLGILKEVMERT